MIHIQQQQERRAAMSGLKQLAGVVAGALALMSATPAMAEVIDFQSQAPTIYFGGDKFAEAGYSMSVLDTAAGGGGFAGAIADGLDPNTCSVAACPTGNNSLYYLGLNDGGLNIKRTDTRAFTLHSLDYSFLAPLAGLPNFSYGQLVLTGKLNGGGTIQNTFDFPLQNANGEYAFSAAPLSATFGHAVLSELTISACLYDIGGSCANPAANQAQFGIDNLNVSAVPEADAYAMLLAGLAGLALVKRRRAKSSALSSAQA